MESRHYIHLSMQISRIHPEKHERQKNLNTAISLPILWQQVGCDLKCYKRDDYDFEYLVQLRKQNYYCKQTVSKLRSLYPGSKRQVFRKKYFIQQHKLSTHTLISTILTSSFLFPLSLITLSLYSANFRCKRHSAGQLPLHSSLDKWFECQTPTQTN